MTEEEKAAARLKVLLKLAAKILGIKQTALEADLDKQDGYTLLMDRYETLTTEADEASFKGGTDKVVGMLSKELKALGFTGKIDALNTKTFKQIGEFIKEQVGKKSDDDDDDDDDDTDKPNKPAKKVDESEVVRSLREQVKTLKREKTELENAHAEKLEEINATNDRNLRRVEVRGMAEKALTTNKALIPKDADIAKDKLDRYLRDLDDFDYEKDERTGDWFLLDKEGNRVKEKGVAVKASDKFSRMVDIHYGRMQTDPKKGGGLPDPNADDDNRPPGSRSGSSDYEMKIYKGAPPKDEAELNKWLDDPQSKLTFAEKEDLMNYGEKAFAQPAE